MSVRRYEFRWNEWNVGHIAAHGVTPQEAEYVVDHARSPYPTYQGDGRFLVRGQTAVGRWLQVVYIFSPRGVVYVIHARPIPDREKRRTRRRNK
jgi:uncharacterized DUF497 family protein